MFLPFIILKIHAYVSLISVIPEDMIFVINLDGDPINGLK